MAERISHFQYQAVTNWQKVHDFFIKYQDRLIYATDEGVRANTNPHGDKKYFAAHPQYHMLKNIPI